MQPLFPRWTNLLPHALLFGFLGFAALVIGATWYYATPSFWEVGYMPTQPLNYSHKIHVNKLGMDCRYCHTFVDQSQEANIPSVSTCMSCHTVVDEKSGYLQKAVSPDGTTPSAHWRSEDLSKLRTYYASGEPIPWRRIHKLPEYVQFNHAVHYNAGVSCYSCHKRIDQMPVVYQAENLAMGWCLDCHRAPEDHLVDVHGEMGLGALELTDLAEVERTLGQEDYAETIGERLAERLDRAPPEHCFACHY